MRLDIYLAQCGLARSRTEASRLIKDGCVSLCGSVCTTPSRDVPDGEDVQVDRSGCRYVSRGGLKLEAALKHFGISPVGQIALDIGASTGGFTDCLLQFGARKVYALENGHGQLGSQTEMSGIDICTAPVRSIPEILKNGTPDLLPIHRSGRTRRNG